MTLKIIVVDGLSVETTDAGAKAIEKLQADKATHDTAMAAKDTELATKDAEIKKLKEHS